MVMASPTTCDSSVLPHFHGCPAFLHRHFPPQSPPSHPLDLSLHSQQQPLLWDCSTVPKLQFSATAPSGGPVSLSQVCMTDSAVTALLPWLPDFPPQEFPTTVSSLTSPGSLSPQSTAVLALGLLQYLNSSSQPLHLPGDLHPCLRHAWLQQGLSNSRSL